jgi:hypothetical protein
MGVESKYLLHNSSYSCVFSYFRIWKNGLKSKNHQILFIFIMVTPGTFVALNNLFKFIKYKQTKVERRKTNGLNQFGL